MAFGVVEFELALLHRMRDVNAAKVEEALEARGASRTELREAHAHWTRLTHVRRGVSALRVALGPPPHRARRPAGSLTCDVLRWPLPTWPGLEYEALLGPGGELWNQWFVRASGPVTTSLADLTPWGFVVADVAASFPGAVQIDGPAPHHWTVDFRHDGEDYRARFVYGLFQRLDRKPDPD
ncbi:hypothetical protein AB0I81_04475 [Nonomuraea sp. NPDC050404]|uniref:hypothetical protein n=1 Tax=Nonomuraea sp. NPDC050404 TaxID=3155783 RepID=UPI003402E3F0